MKNRWFLDSTDIVWLKENYFFKHGETISISKGDTLLETGVKNRRLYIILEGELRGYLIEGQEKYEVFRSTENMFLGVYSFFAEEHESYSTVIADTDSKLCYLGESYFSDPEFRSRFLPVLVHELKVRQALAQQMNIERQMVMQKLFGQEKLATLGQLAAGLAHELNNAVAMIQRKTEFMSEWLSEYISDQESSEFSSYLSQGIEKGLEYSSKEVREIRKDLEKQGINKSTAEVLANLGDFKGDLRNEDQAAIEKRAELMDVGRALHNISVAAKHAAHVVTSVKELGVQRRQTPADTDINETIKEALLLLRSKVGKVHVKEEYEKLPLFQSYSGDLVQVWLNLIKNATESLIGSKTKDPTIAISTSFKNDQIKIIVHDNGPGIPSHIQNKVFEPNVTTKVHGLSFGLGLGLAIVDKIIQAYGGSIKMSSKSGETIFTTTLPVN
ncbi:MAG: ATP-binding protein [Bacteroidota bacterium]